jgi:TctA family transporter
MTDLMIRGSTIADMPRLGKGLLKGASDVLHNMSLVLRCSALGTYLGFLPGLGAAPANWMAYGHAVQSGKDKTSFGKGNVQGVIAPEAANDASNGGSLIPTLLFGIPGSAMMAVFLFALMILGVHPGPDMLTNHLNLVFFMVWTLALGNVLATLICLLITRPIAYLTVVPVFYWIPFVLMMVILGAFQATRHWGDLICLLAFGLFGWFMKRTGWPRPPLLIGFVLGSIAENYLWISVLRYGAAWLLRPGVILIFVITVVSFLMGFRWQQKKVPMGGL